MLIYVHKNGMLDAVAERHPARYYVMVDDKLRILAAMKRTWKDRGTTIFPHQDHYSLDPNNLSVYPAADLTVQLSATIDDPVVIQRIDPPVASYLPTVRSPVGEHSSTVVDQGPIGIPATLN